MSAWTYNSKTGALWSPSGEPVGYGYSGTGEGRDNPSLEHIRMVGPIPRGEWHVGKAYTHKKLGVLVSNLDPVGHDAHGRSLFRIHGDNRAHDASNGCIILSRPLRIMIDASKDRTLNVV